MRLITYNIRKGLGPLLGNGSSVSALGRAIGEHAPDVVLCQEVFHDWHGLEHQSLELKDHLGLHYYYEPNKKRRVGHHGNASFTRFPVEVIENFDVSTNPVERRGVLYTLLMLPEGPVHVFNVHLGLNYRQRRKQIDKIAQLLERLVQQGEAVLIAGDFNDWHDRLEPHIVKDLAVTNAFSVAGSVDTRSWPSQRPVFSLDRVYVRNMSVRRARRFAGEPWNVLSDHLPLLVELKISPR